MKSPTLRYPETGFEEIGVTESLFLEAHFGLASLKVCSGHNFRLARHTISEKQYFLASVLRIFHRFTFHEPHR